MKLVELAEEFHKRYQEAKKDKNIVDFNDLEHEALRILIKKEGETLSYTSVADELSRRYAEILVDEYQDSNLVQECILSCISGGDAGHYNRFMVGDVKQSIYKFRLARPELFLEKYAEYGNADKQEGQRVNARKIDLHQNFRSRETVLHPVNEVFRRIMCRELGASSTTMRRR